MTLAEYPDAHHAYDNPAFATPLHVAQGQTTRNCHLQEGRHHPESKTGQPYDLATDPCVEKGPHVAYDAAAHQATLVAVKEFLRTTFKPN